MSVLRTPSVPRSLRLAVLVTGVGLLGYFAFQSITRSTDREDSEGRTSTIGVSVQGGENPLGSGEKIPVEAASLLILKCLCPQLPGSGPLSTERVDAAWTDSSGQLLLQFENGIDLYYDPDARSEETFLADWEQAIFEGWPGTIIPLRQTRAAAAERDDAGPAVITWLEGPYHLAMHGNGGQSLAELTQLAESLGTATEL